ncbi:MAG: transglutaminaseTgpA domain-containing protein [Actinomycetes bacterium]
MRSRLSIAIAATIATALGSLTLLPTYANLSWLAVTWGAVLVVGLVAQGSRMLGVPPVLSPALAVAGLAAYVTAVFAHGAALFGFLPGSGARTTLSALTRQGWHDISALRAPVPTHQSLVLLTVVGVGLVAVVVDLIAVVARRPALAGLPLLALFAVSASTVPRGVGWLPFVYAGAGYLALLLTESTDRISRWGHPLGAAALGTQPAIRAERAKTAPLMQVGRRVGFAAIAVAVVVPLVVPGMHAGLFGTNGGHGPGFGNSNSTVTTYNPILRIREQLSSPSHQPLLKYATNDADPAYLRMTALDRYDGSGWTQGDLTAPSSHQVSKGLPAPTGLAPEVQTQLTKSNVRATNRLQIPWLPLPYPSVSVAVDKGDWRWDDASGAIFSTQTNTRGRSWTATSERLLPTRAQLIKAPGGRVPAGALPDLDLPRRVTPFAIYDTAQKVTAGARTPFEQALKLQDYFHSPKFHYDLNAPSGDGADVVTKFLEDGHGYCVQFASTMALMARALHIPARVAIGFTHGSIQTDGTYLVTTADAHAWPELYFDGYGWLQFEPTPRGDGQAEPPNYTRTTPQGPAPGTTGNGATPTPQPTPTPTRSLSPQLKHALDEPLPAVFAKHNKGGPWRGVLLGLICLLVLATVPGVARLLTRRRRWSAAETDAARAHAAWRELADDVWDLGFAWGHADSPRRAASRLVTTTGLTQTQAELKRLAAAEEESRYARALPADNPAAGDLGSDLREVRRELTELAGWRRRYAAAVLPRSTVRTMASFAANRIADLFDLIDVAAALGYRLLVPQRLRRSAPAP